MILSLDNIQLKTGDSTFVVFRFYIEYFFIINIGTLSGAYKYSYFYLLFWTFRSAHRPKAAPYATSHYYNMIIHTYHPPVKKNII